jgi:translation initiation factor IF-1
VEVLSSTQVRVDMANGSRITATLSGEIRLNFIEILPGDKVLLELSPYDLSSGRIVKKQS